MEADIKQALEVIERESKLKPIKVISHFDTDGITAAAIFSRALSRWNKKFSLEIVKNLEESYIEKLPNDAILIFLDLGSGSLEALKKKQTQVIIIDHHEVAQEIPENVLMVHPLLKNREPISGAGLAYLCAKEISKGNKDLANLAVVGMVGDLLEKNLSKEYSWILSDSDATIKKGLLIYPSTRPIDRALEYSSNPYIPGISGSYTGVMELRREAGLTKENGKFKSLSELDEEEMRSLVTSVMLRKPRANEGEIVGNIYLLKMFNQLEDARELSALINACSRMDRPDIALGFCLGNKTYKQEAEKIYINYKQHLISALKYVEEGPVIRGSQYTIINAQDKVKDTIIGTIASIVSHSSTYEEGTVIIALAYNQDKIKVSARLVGRKGRNVREVLTKVIAPFGGEVGGHPEAAGCLIDKTHEEQFIAGLKQTLDISQNTAQTPD